jgi:O-antigen ligase
MPAATSWPQPTTSTTAAVVAAGLALATLLGLMIGAGVPPLLLAIGIAPIVIALAVWWPPFGLLLLLGLIYSVVPAPPLPLLGGTMQSSDLALLGLAAVLAVRAVREPASLFGRNGRVLLLPLAALAALAVVSFVHAMVVQTAATRDVLAEARHFLYWLLAPMVVLALRDAVTLRRFVLALVGLGLVIAAIAAAQSIFGIQILRGRVEALETLGHYYGGVVRTITPGIYLVVFALLAAAARYALGASGLAVAGALMVLPAIAVVFGFGRAIWAAALAALALLLVGLGPLRGLKLAFVAALGGLTVTAILLVAKPAVLEAVVDRAVSLPTEVDRGSSFAWRRLENEYAVKALAKSPLLGIGLGGDYKPVLNHALRPEQTRHLHNGYLYLVLKLGALAAIVPLWLALCCLVLLRRAWGAALEPADRAAAAACFAAFMVPMLTSFTQPEWMTYTGVATLALFAGLLAAAANVAEGDAA